MRQTGQINNYEFYDAAPVTFLHISYTPYQCLYTNFTLRNLPTMIHFTCDRAYHYRE
jgi:hypothetical protein